MYKWLKRNFEDRSIAEMGIYYCIFILAGLLVTPLIILAAGYIVLHLIPQGLLRDNVITFTLLAAFAVVPIFLIWLWWSLVKIARSGSVKSLGVEYLKYLQIAFLIFAVPQFIFDFSQAQIILMVIFFFDAFIMLALIVTLTIACIARCKIPLGTYLSILTVIVLFILQAAMAG